MTGTKTMLVIRLMQALGLIGTILKKQENVCVAVLGAIFPSFAALLFAMGAMRATTKLMSVFVLSVPVQDSPLPSDLSLFSPSD